MLSGFPFLVTQCEGASSCHCKNTTRSWETWLLVLALLLPYASLFLFLSFPFYICKIRGLDLIILKSCASSTSYDLVGELQESDKPFLLPSAEGQMSSAAGFGARQTCILANLLKLSVFSSIKWEEYKVFINMRDDVWKASSTVLGTSQGFNDDAVLLLYYYFIVIFIHYVYILTRHFSFSLCLSFLIQKMRVITEPTSSVNCED